MEKVVRSQSFMNELNNFMACFFDKCLLHFAHLHLLNAPQIKQENVVGMSAVHDADLEQN